MDINERFDWKALDDDMLEQRLEQERVRSARALSKEDRAIAHKNVDAILCVQVTRYEKKWMD